MGTSTAICIAHHRHRDDPWLSDLLYSIDTSYPIIISNHTGWVMDAIRLAFLNTPFDEIFFLNTSMIVKDNSIWDIAFKEYEGQSVAVGDKFLMHLGKYRREIVEKTSFPVIHNKADEVYLGEFGWTREYMALEPDYVSVQPITDTFERFEEKHGRKNMILENDYFIKYKAHWDASSLND